MSWGACFKFFNCGLHDEKSLETIELDYLKGVPSSQHLCNTPYHCVLVLIL